MDFLNKAFAQLTDLFRSMTVGTRITTGIMLVLIVVSLAYLFRAQSTGSDHFLMGGETFSGDELKRMCAAFGAANLTCTPEGNKIRIPRGQDAAYMAALVEHRALPNNAYRYIEDVLASENALMPSDRQTREEKMRVGRERMLAETIRRMRGVDSAIVTFATEMTGGLNKVVKNKASVSIRPIGGQALDPELAVAIRKYVSGSLAGLTAENVTMIDEATGTVYSGDIGPGGNLLNDRLFAAMKTYEDRYRTLITSQLADIRGVLVTVTADVDPKSEQREQELKHNPKPIVRQSMEKSSSKMRESAAPGGRVGFGANQPGAVAAQAQSSAKGTRDEEETSVTQNVNALDTTTRETQTSGHSLRQVRVSVRIPESHFVKIWEQRNPAAPGDTPKPPTPADLTKIRDEQILAVKNAVATILPPPAEGVDATKLIDVSPYQNIPSERIPETPITNRLMDFLSQYWTTLGVMLLVLISLTMLRSMIRSAPVTAQAPGMKVSGAATPATRGGKAEEAPEAEETPTERRLKRLTGTGKSLRDELSDLVAEDPDAAANILRTWIGNVT